MPKKSVSTFDREMKNSAFKAAFKKSYKTFLISELLISMMDNDKKSVRELAKEAHLSPTVIQKVRSRKQNDMKMRNFINISRACGYQIILKKGKDSLSL